MGGSIQIKVTTQFIFKESSSPPANVQLAASTMTILIEERMAQDKETGARAAAWGNATATALAHALGASPTGNPGNEYLFNGEPITIKCARPKTTKVGVTHKMLTRIKFIFGAFQRQDGDFDVWSLAAQTYQEHMQLTGSKGASAGRVSMVSRGVFRSEGSFVGVVSLLGTTPQRGSIAVKAKQASRLQTDPTFELLRQVKVLARKFRELTGRPLGATGELAEHEAARLLDLKLAPPRQAGYDAIEKRNGTSVTVQIKGRCVLSNNPGQRMGSIDVDKPCDKVMLVLMDESFDAYEIYEAPFAVVADALRAPGSKVRNVNGALSVSKFKKIGSLRWCRPEN